MTTAPPPPPDTNCHAGSLRVAFGEESGAGGRSYSTYHLTNAGAQTCTLGQPQLAYLNAAGAVVKQVTPATGAALALAPGAVATLTISDLSSCSAAVATAVLRVTPPTDTTGVSVPAKVQACSPAATALTPGAS